MADSVKPEAVSPLERARRREEIRQQAADRRMGGDFDLGHMDVAVKLENIDAQQERAWQQRSEAIRRVSDRVPPARLPRRLTRKPLRPGRLSLDYRGPLGDGAPSSALVDAERAREVIDRERAAACEICGRAPSPGLRTCSKHWRHDDRESVRRINDALRCRKGPFSRDDEIGHERALALHRLGEMARRARIRVMPFRCPSPLEAWAGSDWFLRAGRRGLVRKTLRALNIDKERRRLLKAGHWWLFSVAEREALLLAAWPRDARFLRGVIGLASAMPQENRETRKRRVFSEYDLRHPRRLERKYRCVVCGRRTRLGVGTRSRWTHVRCASRGALCVTGAGLDS